MNVLSRLLRGLSAILVGVTRDGHRARSETTVPGGPPGDRSPAEPSGSDVAPLSTWIDWGRQIRLALAEAPGDRADPKQICPPGLLAAAGRGAPPSCFPALEWAMGGAPGALLERRDDAQSLSVAVGVAAPPAPRVMDAPTRLEEYKRAFGLETSSSVVGGLLRLASFLLDRVQAPSATLSRHGIAQAGRALTILEEADPSLFREMQGVVFSAPTSDRTSGSDGPWQEHDAGLAENIAQYWYHRGRWLFANRQTDRAIANFIDAEQSWRNVKMEGPRHFRRRARNLFALWIAHLEERHQPELKSVAEQLKTFIPGIGSEDGPRSSAPAI